MTAHISLYDLLKDSAQHHGDRRAFAQGARIATYSELLQDVRLTAGRLAASGVQAGERVAVYAGKQYETVVMLLAINAHGAILVPINPQLKEQQVRHILLDSGARLLVSTGARLRRIEAALKDIEIDTWPLEKLQLDNLNSSADTALGNASPAVTDNDPAAILYTSGSTGRPKGALLSHANVTRLLSATQGVFTFGPSDVWTLFHSYAFDFSVWELFGALCTGGRLVIVPYFISREPQAFHQLLCDEQVTVLNQTPTAFRQLLPIVCNSPQALALRWVIFGGEALEVSSLRPWYERFGSSQTTLVNMYGITETTVHVTFRALSPSDLDAKVQSPIGQPLRDLSWYLLDSQLQPVPAGCAGELYIAGAGLARGYHGRAGLTAERFVASPFVPGERLYRSGDLARQRADGNIDYLGRIDQQVKIRGFRIELGEIEACLKHQIGVAEAVLSVHQGQLCAYVVADQTPVDPLLWREQLRAALKVDLPDYMVPSHWLLLDALPLTGNGKLDRNALPLPDTEVSQRPYRAPVGELETQLAAIWASVLGVERVGRDDNFFELGGHSLLAAQASARVELELGIELALRALFEAADLHTYAALAQAQTPADNAVRLSALESLLDEMEIN